MATNGLSARRRGRPELTLCCPQPVKPTLSGPSGNGIICAVSNFFAELKRRHIFRVAEEPRVGRHLAAIFAADVAGYSQLMGQDEAGTVGALSAARATMGCLIAEHGGRLVNAVGDSVLAEFPSPVDAVKCALAVQERLAEAEAADRLPIRIAVHVGDVMPSGADIFGDGINVCARLQEVAEPRGICISGAAYQYVRKALSVAFDDLGERKLKNIDEPVRVFAIRAAERLGHSPAQTKPSAADLTVAPRQAKMQTPGWIIASGLATALAIFLIYQFAIQPSATTARQQTKAAPSVQASTIAIAVLPFDNLSSDPEQEFFSDGVTEEITAALAKIPDLRVVARSSAFQFKGQKRDLRVVGQALGANHLIEGSVRKAGNRVRITAQLIRADNGTHIWSDEYDRQLTDIFAIQEDIATAIAAALRVPLGLQQGQTLVSSRDIDQESYQQYLRARTIYRSQVGNLGAARRLGNPVEMLEQVVARHPGYAPAWGLLAMITGREAAAREAIQLDSRSATGYAALATIQFFQRGNFAAAEDLTRQALALDPNEPEVLDLFARNLHRAGRIKEALTIYERLHTVEPFIPQYNLNRANTMMDDGQNGAAMAILEALPATMTVRNIALAKGYAAAGRYGDAADALLAEGELDPDAGPREEAARLLQSAPAKITAPEVLPVFRAQLSFVYAYLGAPERGLDDPERLVAEGRGLPLRRFRHLWSPEYAPIRNTARFKALMRNAGFVDYWRAKGWPDKCRPVGADDFVCD
jgi:adenylate cyclase